VEVARRLKGRIKELASIMVKTSVGLRRSLESAAPEARIQEIADSLAGAVTKNDFFDYTKQGG
jgi:hypothetical protein